MSYSEPVALALRKILISKLGERLGNEVKLSVDGLGDKLSITIDSFDVGIGPQPTENFATGAYRHGEAEKAILSIDELLSKKGIEGITTEPQYQRIDINRDRLYPTPPEGLAVENKPKLMMVIPDDFASVMKLNEAYRIGLSESAKDSIVSGLIAAQAILSPVGDEAKTRFRIAVGEALEELGFSLSQDKGRY